MNINDIIEKLKGEDETTILELLDIESEELVDAFKKKIRSRRDYIEKFFGEESPDEELYGWGIHIETWKDQWTNED